VGVRASLRIGLRTISIATIGVAAWLVAAILSGRASRGQDLVGLWSIVTVACVALVWVSISATRSRGGEADAGSAASVLAGLGAAAFAFGLFVLGSEFTRAGEGEGYLFGIGLLLTIHGLLAVAWGALSRLAPVGGA
jgi:hypothetical protein